MKKHTAANMIPALKSIGYNMSDIPSHNIKPGRILVQIPDNDSDEADKILEKLRKNLPAGAKAEWTGNSDTCSDGETTSDCEITWDEA